MTRTPPTLERLRDLGHKLLADGRSQLESSKNIVPVIILGDAADGAPDQLIGIQSEIMSSNSAKEALCAMVHKLIDQHGYFHAVSLLDAFSLKSKDTAESNQIMRLHSLGMGLQNIAILGMGTLIEMLMVNIETSGRSLWLHQEYRRNKDGVVTSFEDIVEDHDKVDGGRFKFFGERADVEEILKKGKGR